jgi:hypothetical protein
LIIAEANSTAPTTSRQILLSVACCVLRTSHHLRWGAEVDVKYFNNSSPDVNPIFPEENDAARNR